MYRILLVLFALSAQAEEPRLLAGPDVLVSRENEFPHMEMMISAHPTDPRRLVAASMVLVAGDIGSGTIVYRSEDGGATWIPGYPPERVESDADPLVLYTPRGSALYLDLAAEPMKSPEGKTYLPVILYRSEDGGRRWQKPLLLGAEGGYDHPQIATDPRTGRIHVSALVGRESRLELFRSDDDGRTFTGPRQMIKAPSEEAGLNTAGLAVLSDGALVHSYIEFPMGELQDTDRESRLWVMVSGDGGETFAAPVFAGKVIYPPRTLDPEHRAQVHTFPQMTADSSAGPFRDRIYLAWTDYRSGQPQVMLTWSADRGKTWAEPRTVATPLPDKAYSFHPALAVNKDGVLGLSWLDTRGHPGTDRYDAYFSASLDGGETFLPPIRLSSETSDPLGTGNLRPSPGSWADSQKRIRVTFLTALSRFANGGDYMGLAADADGIFHPLWPDARTGTFQAWTTRVRVERGPAATAKAASSPPVNLREHVELRIDPASYDPETRELRLPIRIRNRSDRPIRGPLQVKVTAFGSGMGERLKENAPTILNADNGQPRDGAVFDYSRALGDFDVLEPGAVTAPVVWRFRTVATETPDMHLEVTGRVD